MKGFIDGNGELFYWLNSTTYVDAYTTIGSIEDWLDPISTVFMEEI